MAELFVGEIDGRMHAAVVKKGVLDDLYVGAGSWGSLYLGKVVKTDKKLESCFVDLGGGFTGMLGARAKTGQMVCVRVKSEGRKSALENTKLPRLAIEPGMAEEGAPRLLQAGPEAIARALGDYGADAFSHIHAGDKKILQEIMRWSDAHDPALKNSKRLRLFRPEKPSEKLFDTHDLYAAIEALEDARVELAGGGSLVIEQTQAATVIDVNQGDAASMLAVNLEAAVEVARQARLRNLSGAILIDFIGMTKKPDRARVLVAAEAAFDGDHAGAQVHGFTRLGILEVTRKRRTASLAEVMRE